jgi:hypothetical protein
VPIDLPTQNANWAAQQQVVPGRDQADQKREHSSAATNPIWAGENPIFVR